MAWSNPNIQPTPAQPAFVIGIEYVGDTVTLYRPTETGWQPVTADDPEYAAVRAALEKKKTT